MPWFTAKDLKSSRVSKAIDTLSSQGVDHAEIAPKGSVLVLVRGMTLHKDLPLSLLLRDGAFNQDVKALIPKDRVDSEFLLYALEARKHELLSCVDAAGHGTGRLATEAIESLRIYVPTLSEQRRIVGVLRTWDDAIERAQKYTEALTARLQRLRESLTSSRQVSNRATVTLGEITHELLQRNGTRLGADAVMGVNKGIGLAPMRDRSRAADLTRYKVLPPNSFAYNPMRLNIGSIAMSRLAGDVLVSPDYVVLAANVDVCDARYLDHLRHTKRWESFVAPAGSGSVRIRIYYDDLASLRLEVPTLETQRKIADALDTAVRERELAERQLQLFITQKATLTAKLLSGQLTAGACTETLEAAQ